MRALERTLDWRRHIARAHEEKARGMQPIGRVERCSACDGADHEAFVHVYGFDYHLCGACGHLFLRNPPDPAVTAALYQGLTPQAHVYADDVLFERRVERIARPKVAFCREHVPPEGVWFDVGCGTGELLRAVGEAGWQPRGCEADPEFVSFARRRGFEVLSGYVEHLPADMAASVRVISALNVLEHVPEPRRWLAHLTAALGRGGHVVIEVPRHPSISSLSNLLFPDLAARHIYPPDHLHVFSERSLEVVLGACGLEARALWTFGQDFQELVCTSAARAGIGESAFLHQVLDAADPIQRAIDEQGLSDVAFVIAQKV